VYALVITAEKKEKEKKKGEKKKEEKATLVSFSRLPMYGLEQCIHEKLLSTKTPSNC